MRCEICDTEIPVGATECPHCGFEVKWMRGAAGPGNVERPVRSAEDASEQVRQMRKAQRVNGQENRKKNGKKTSLVLLVAIAVVVAATAVVGWYVVSGKLHVENIAVSKWMLTNEGYSNDYYSGLVTSDETKPFVAVIGGGSSDSLSIIYMNDGQGTLQMSVPSGEDPSLAWETKGYIAGKAVNEKDFDEINYYGSEYFDFDLSSLDSSYSDYTSSTVEIDVTMKKNTTGILVYDVEDNANQTFDYNHAMAIIDGAGSSIYLAENLPYKSRGMEDITIIPRIFCAAEKLDQNYTSSDESFIMDKEVTKYTSLSNRVKFSGRMNLVLSDYSDGFVIYSATQTAGGEPDERDVVMGRYTRVFPGGRFSIETSNTYDIDDKVSEPEFSFHIAGYLAWKTFSEN